MKKNLFTGICLIFLVSIITSCGGNSDKNMIPTDIVSNPNSASGEGNRGTLPKFEFKTLEHDFGNLIEGEVVSFSFKFKNVGGSDLIISQAKADCGCTVAKYTDTPVKPGNEGKVSITFNSNLKHGIQNKKVTLIANTQPNTKVLRIKATVVKPEK